MAWWNKAVTPKPKYTLMIPRECISQACDARLVEDRNHFEWWIDGHPVPCRYDADVMVQLVDGELRAGL